MNKRCTEERVIGFPREADAGLPVKEQCSKHGLREPSYCAWNARFGGIDVSRESSGRGGASGGCAAAAGTGLSERRVLRLVDIRASTLCRQPCDGQYGLLRECLTALAGQDCRHGQRMRHTHQANRHDHLACAPKARTANA